MLNMVSVEFTEDVLVVLARDLTIVQISQVALDLFSWQKQAVQGKNFFSCLTLSAIEFEQNIPQAIQHVVTGVIKFNIFSANLGSKTLFCQFPDNSSLPGYVYISGELPQKPDFLKQNFFSRNLVELVQMVEHNNPNQLNQLITQFMCILPGKVHIKEAKNLTYIGGNQSFMEYYKINTVDNYLNKTIFDFVKNMENIWPKELPEEVSLMEKQVIATKTPFIDCIESYTDDQGLLLVHSLNKIPILDQTGEVKALLTIALDQTKAIGRRQLRQLYKKIYSSKSKAVYYFLLHLGLTRFTINHPLTTADITDRELDCLILLAAGKTVKEVANFLGLSPRTVESYVDHIKQKCNFYSTQAMIEEFFKMYFSDGQTLVA